MIKALVICACYACHAVAALAQDSQRGDYLDATLLTGWQTDTGNHMAGLRIGLAPGWKTYWRAPGEAGIPPLFNWSGSENLKSVQVHWPTPAVFQTNGIQSIGYHDQVTLPLEVTALDPTKPVRLHATVELGVCKDICLPASLDLTADLTPRGTPDAAIRAALADQPKAARTAGLTSIVCTVDPIADGMQITAKITIPTLGPTEIVAFESGQPDIWVAQAKTRRNSGQLVSVTDMVAPTGAPFAIERSKIKLTILAGQRAVEIQGCPAS